MKYSIVYAITQPGVNERLSIGIIFMDDENTKFVYSGNKLRALKELFSENEMDFFKKMLNNMATDKSLITEQSINYLCRYSNNLMALSPLQIVDVPMTEESTAWAFKQFVDRNYNGHDINSK